MINTNYMPGAAGGIPQNKTGKQLDMSGSDEAFMEKVREKLSAVEQGMTMEEYRQYFRRHHRPFANSSDKKESWWDKRQRRMREFMEDQAKKAQLKAQAQSALASKISLNNHLESQLRLECFLKEGAAGEFDAERKGKVSATDIKVLEALAYDATVSLSGRSTVGSRKTGT